MDINRIGSRPLGLVAGAALAVGLVAVAPAADAARGPAGYGHHVVSARVANGTLTIVGTNRDDHVTLSQGTEPSRLLVDLGDGAGAQSVDQRSFTNVAAFLRGGNDTFGASSAVLVPITVVGGRGNDTMSGGGADDLLAGGRGNDTILGGDGNDVIVGGRGNDTVDGQRGTATEILGRGEDKAQWLPGEGNDDIDGGSGADTLIFDGANGNEKFALSASGAHAIFTRDLGNIRMDTDNVEALDLATLGGTDAVTVGDLTGTALRDTDVDLGAGRGGASDGQLDTIDIDGTDRPDRVDVGADRGAVDVNGLHSSVRV